MPCCAVLCVAAGCSWPLAAADQCWWSGVSPDGCQQLLNTLDWLAGWVWGRVGCVYTRWLHSWVQQQRRHKSQTSGLSRSHCAGAKQPKIEREVGVLEDLASPAPLGLSLWWTPDSVTLSTPQTLKHPPPHSPHHTPSHTLSHPPGIYVKPTRDRDALTAMLVREGYLPVWLESGLLDAYYNGFCNRCATGISDGWVGLSWGSRVFEG